MAATLNAVAATDNLIINLEKDRWLLNAMRLAIWKARFKNKGYLIKTMEIADC
jgi:hypothetical protein